MVVKELVVYQMVVKAYWCCLSDGGEGLLVLFDQHAAHERVRLEQLTSGRLCLTVSTVQMWKKRSDGYYVACSFVALSPTLQHFDQAIVNLS